VVWNAVKAGKPVPERFAETAARYKAALSAVASAKAEGSNPLSACGYAQAGEQRSHRDIDIGTAVPTKDGVLHEAPK